MDTVEATAAETKEHKTRDAKCFDEKAWICGRHWTREQPKGNPSECEQDRTCNEK